MVWASTTVSVTGAPQAIPVTLTVVDAPTTPILSRTPASFFREIVQGENAASDTFQVQNLGAGTLTYEIQDDASWMSQSPVNGGSTGESDTINLNFSTTQIPVGVYTNTITITGNGALSSPQTIEVGFVTR